MIALADETKQKNDNNSESKQHEVSSNVEIVSEKESKPIQKSELFEPCAKIKNETLIRLEPLVNSYKDTLFSKNIGQFTDFQVKLHINDKVPPIAQPERRIPFALRNKVKSEIDKLERLGIIEEVKGQPTPWLNPIVVVPKGKDDIRICLDMRAANRATTRIQIPDHVWQTVNTDYLGPLPDNKYALVMIDQRSRYPVVTFTNNTTAKNFITICNNVFGHFGFPETLISDNGPPFRSNDVKTYTKGKGIKHRRVTPLWLQANGEVEKFMLPLTKVICTAHIENKNFIQEERKRYIITGLKLYIGENTKHFDFLEISFQLKNTTRFLIQNDTND